MQGFFFNHWQRVLSRLHHVDYQAVSYNKNINLRGFFRSKKLRKLTKKLICCTVWALLSVFCNCIQLFRSKKKTVNFDFHCVKRLDNHIFNVLKELDLS